VSSASEATRGPSADQLEPARPRARGWIHRVAFFVVIPLGIVLVVVAPTLGARIASAIYAISLAALFGVSSTFHLGTWSPSQRERWRRLDHGAIFVLIAGSYTPYCVLALEGAWAPAILAVVWVGAVAGIVLKAHRTDLHVISGFMYIGLGWTALVAFPQLVGALTTPELVLTVTSGLLYTGGAVVLATHRPNPWPRTFGYHEVWHACTVTAAASQYAAVLMMLLRAG
jgi:hemolysin III